MANEPSDSAMQLKQLVDRDQGEAVRRHLAGLSQSEALRAVLGLDEELRTRLLTLLDPQTAAGVVDSAPGAQAVDLIEHLEPATAAAIVSELRSDEQADLIGDLDADDAEAILAEMTPESARDVRELSRYADDVAGGLMVTECLTYPSDLSASAVIQDIRHQAERYRDYQVQYAFVTDRGNRLIGVLRMRDLLLARSDQPISSFMIGKPLSVADTTPLAELEEFFERHRFFGVPVVGDRGELLGVVQRSAVARAAAERAGSDYLKSQGIVGGEELRTMPLLQRSRRRLGWLSINVGLNVVAASVIALYQETLAAVIALAVFLPIISDMSGCSGNQAVAVSMRELTLGLVRPSELLRVWGKEVSVGLINGAALGILVGAAAWAWKASPYLGLVVGAAMAINTLVAVSLGGALPLLLRRFGVDPALASGPILTTVTDMCGFFLILSLAAAMLEYLV